MPYYPTPDSLENGDLISCHIARKTAEIGNFNEAFRNLSKLIKNSQLIRKFQDKMIIHISGYDDDPRPLWEIPDARRGKGVPLKERDVVAQRARLAGDGP